MAKIPFMLSGAGDGSDDCTATAADVLEGKTAIYNGSDDDAVAGTMKDYSGTATQATGTMNSSNSRVQMAIPNTGKYDTAANLYVPYSTMRTLIGYTDASKVLTGTTICGLAGTMADKSGSTTSVTPTLASSQVRMTIPSNGYYNTSAYLYQSYSNFASLIGLTAAKIKYGETILGITGTWQGWVATSTDVYYNGSTGVCGSASAYGSSGVTVTLDSSCIVVAHQATTSESGGAVFGTALSCAGYSKITMTYQIATAPSSASSNNWIGLGLYTSKPTSYGDCNLLTNALIYENKQIPTSTGTNTISIDLSSVSQSLYVVIGAYGSSSSNYYWTANVTRIALS